eukprot:TRINITY_DN109181_c0_g1_i1.p1 TRINITY_DN109181_c0_g1~~TRINITY_DN109181_c0_g1_i1.p1  ORF type:complete len:548 (-),score=107.61 TRINITY_DN109181_c0_g1_i1:43-1485(-)
MTERQEHPEGLPGLARPLFSAQLSLAKGVAEALGEAPSLVHWREAVVRSASSDEKELDAVLDMQGLELPLGFALPDGQRQLLGKKDLRSRRLSDTHSADSSSSNGQPASGKEPSEEKASIVAVFFPLLSAVVTAWLRGAAAKAQRRVVVLASGRAEPRDMGADSLGNSTERTADLMVRFLRQAHGQGDRGIIAEALHGSGDAFRYDANLRFCHELVLPFLDAEREEVARRCGDAWPEKFSVTLALCDGTHSRLQVLSQCLREFRPEMAHLSPLKAFWHSCALRPKDVDRESYERAFEAAPPTDVENLSDPALNSLVSEVIAHRNSFLFAQPRDNAGDAPQDLERFWLRKSKKPVLSVLVVRRESGPLRMHRGINLEVSMPTGSLCAERNVIGTAFAADPSLRREDLRAIAVLAVDGLRSRGAGSLNLTGAWRRGRNPLAPCGACMEWLRKIYEVNPSFRVVTFEDESCRHMYVKTVGRMS